MMRMHSRSTVRVFGSLDQEWFARLSGDYNPIHMDPVAARRLLFGRPIVHGIHALLWALDDQLGVFAEPARLKRLKVKFRYPIILGESVELLARGESPTERRIEIRASDVKLLTASVSFESGTADRIAIPVGIPVRGPCVDCPRIELSSTAGRLPLCLDSQIVAQRFPNVRARLPPEQVATLLAATRLVGMHAPGLHSVLSGLDLRDCGDQREPELHYRTESYDERVLLLNLQIDGSGLSGLVSAFVRPEPRKQSPLLSLNSAIRLEEFRGERVLVIGGSRGL